jgi:hypothetical protein
MVIARLAAVAAVIVLAAGCTSAASQAPAPSTSPIRAHATSARFDGVGLTFSYPADWKAATWSDDISENSWMIVALSTTAQQDPCDSSVMIGSARLKSICQQPVVALPPGRMLVTWTEHGFRNWHKPVMTTVVSGRPASETHAMGSWCKQLGGQETITVVIPRSLVNNWYEMDACLRGPGLTGAEAQITAMLSSVRIAHGW